MGGAGHLGPVASPDPGDARGRLLAGHRPGTGRERVPARARARVGARRDPGHGRVLHRWLDPQRRPSGGAVMNEDFESIFRPAWSALSTEDLEALRQQCVDRPGAYPEYNAQRITLIDSILAERGA